MTDPRRPVIEPGRPVTEPGRPVTEPGWPVTYPERPVTEPGRPLIEPERPPERRRARRRPAPRAHPFWRFGFPLIVVAAGVAVLLLSQGGARTVLDSTAGEVVDVVQRPDEPGYEVFVWPTPTLLVAHTHDDILTGVTFMAQTDLERGGAAILLPADLIVFYDEGAENAGAGAAGRRNDAGGGDPPGQLLSLAWAEGGLARIEFLAENLFGFGFDEVIELTTDQLATVIGPVTPLPYLLADDLAARTGIGVTTWLAAGRLDLDADTAARVYGFRNPGEADINRVERQRAMWTAWLGSIARADDPGAVVLPFRDGVWPFLKSLGLGSGVVETVPVQPVVLDPGTVPLYILGDEGSEWMAAKALDLVPWPIPAKSFVRPTVRLLDGIGDPAIRDDLVGDIVAAGGAVTVIGNAEEFGVARTVVAYHRPEMDWAAADLAGLLDVEPVLLENPDLSTDLTITVGLDQVVS